MISLLVVSSIFTFVPPNTWHHVPLIAHLAPPPDPHLYIWTHWDSINWKQQSWAEQCNQAESRQARLLCCCVTHTVETQSRERDVVTSSAPDSCFTNTVTQHLSDDNMMMIIKWTRKNWHQKQWIHSWHYNWSPSSQCFPPHSPTASGRDRTHRGKVHQKLSRLLLLLFLFVVVLIHGDIVSCFLLASWWWSIMVREGAVHDVMFLSKYFI